MRYLFNRITNWSTATFGGPEVKGPIGPLKHLKKEADECIENPKDIIEYADCLILVFDAAYRAGFTYGQLMDAAHLKVDVIQTRSYPRLADGEITEHDRSKDAA